MKTASEPSNMCSGYNSTVFRHILWFMNADKPIVHCYCSDNGDECVSVWEC